MCSCIYRRIDWGCGWPHRIFKGGRFTISRLLQRWNRSCWRTCLGIPDGSYRWYYSRRSYCAISQGEKRRVSQDKCFAPRLRRRRKAARANGSKSRFAAARGRRNGSWRMPILKWVAMSEVFPHRHSNLRAGCARTRFCNETAGFIPTRAQITSRSRGAEVRISPEVSVARARRR